MSLSIASRIVGDVAVLTCTGRLVEGDESAALDRQLSEVLADYRFVVLNLGGAPFIDSASLGVLVKHQNRARADGGAIALCSVPSKIREVLTVTRLHTVFPMYDTEQEACLATYPTSPPAPREGLEVDILCVDPSKDLLAYIRQVLLQAGYGVTSTDNLADAQLLIRAMRPHLVVLGASLASGQSQLTAAQAAQTARHGETLRLLNLSPSFARDDAGEAGRGLLAQVSEALSSS